MPKAELTAEQIADSFLDQRIDTPKYTRVSREKEGAILKLAALGKNQVEIAEIIGVSQATVSRTLSELADTRDHAKAILNKSAHTLAERVIKQANVAESLDVLERIEVIAPKKQDSNRSAGVTIVIGMPNQPAGPDPVIDLSPVPFASLAPQQGAASD